MKSHLIKKINKYKMNTTKYLKWIKMDVVTYEQEVNFNDVEK